MLGLACADSQARQSLRRSHTQRMGVDLDSEPFADPASFFSEGVQL